MVWFGGLLNFSRHLRINFRGDASDLPCIGFEQPANLAYRNPPTPDNQDGSPGKIKQNGISVRHKRDIIASK